MRLHTLRYKIVGRIELMKENDDKGKGMFGTYFMEYLVILVIVLYLLRDENKNIDE